ncbi:hypothetical protein M977_03597 [Buttiauxella gaviniae ATCC 51604]|uniref:Uncharacterized protein n=1 Tax=Buttiauxella gaviniae ATCC 51604 TaxID=1354253 RepID=A0A1B7HSS6_9ENTR|nr:hypothetical protein [Buttiauxella gaviniae]OAT18675.1 hypothetical protein M977_03597 [Buttiauxella gaviniae ATCC 51604]
MEIFWIVAGVVVVVIYVINQNKSKTNDRTVIRQTDTYKTETGEIRVERTKVVDNSQTTFHPPQQTQVTPGDAYQNATSKIENFRQSIVPVTKKTSGTDQGVTSVRKPEISAPVLPIEQESEEQFKQCTRCRIMLPFSKFSKSGKHSDGITIWCTDCLRGDKNTRHMKWCPKCKIRRKRTSYYPSTENADKLMAWCKTCVDARKVR